MGPAEKKAVLTGKPVAACPACDDDGHHVPFREPELEHAGAPQIVCDARLHRYECRSWSFGPDGSEYVLRKRLR